MNTNAPQSEICVVIADAQRVGSCNACTRNDRRVALCSIGHFELRLCSSCASDFVFQLRTIPKFVLEPK